MFQRMKNTNISIYKGEKIWKKYLWEVEHEYYCNLGNYYSNDCGEEYDTWEDFFEEWGDADLDFNLLFRWDWNPESNKLYLFYMLQRKGIYRYCSVNIKEEDEQKIIDFLKPKWQHLKGLWSPLE